MGEARSNPEPSPPIRRSISHSETQPASYGYCSVENPIDQRPSFIREKISQYSWGNCCKSGFSYGNEGSCNQEVPVVGHEAGREGEEAQMTTPTVIRYFLE